MAASPRAWRLWLVAFVMFAIAFGLSAWVDTLWEQCDDAYITYQYARRLAGGEGFTFSPGAEPSYGTTTPLWTLILAAIARAGIAPHGAGDEAGEGGTSAQGLGGAGGGGGGRLREDSRHARHERHGVGASIGTGFGCVGNGKRTR